MNFTIQPFDILPLISEYLTKIGYTKQANAIQKKYKYQYQMQAQVQNPLHKKKLKRILQKYVLGNQQILKYLQQREIEYQHYQDLSQQKQKQQKICQIQPIIETQTTKKKITKNKQRKSDPNQNFDYSFKKNDIGFKAGLDGYKVLNGTRGEEFKKQKGKLKNKSFKIGSINDHQINSEPID